MQTEIKKRNYFRFNLQSIQGRFIYLLSVVASSIGILLATNYFIIKEQQQKQQHLLQVWMPSSEYFNTLAMYAENRSLEDKKLLPIINKLNAQASQWEDERLLITYEAMLEKLEALRHKQLTSGAEPLPQEAYADLQKHLQKLQSISAAHIDALSVENENFTDHIKSLFFWQYLGYLIVGFGFSTLIALSVMRKIRVLKTHVTAITSGNLTEKVPQRSDEFYTISKSLNQLIDNLRDITFFAAEVGKGNMDASMNAFDEKSELGRSLSGMRDSLKRVAHEEKNRRWVNEGIARFALIMRTYSGNVDELSAAMIKELVPYVGALQGAIFITHKEGSSASLRMSGCYAYDRQKYLHKQIPADSGLIGQAFQEKLPKYLREIPKDYDTITTGLGQGSPESILMMPLLHEEQVEGVLELASLKQIQEFEMEFLGKIAETLGAAIAAVRISEETRKLLSESQLVTETLRAQEEEMRQNMEEMQATQEEMARAQKELAVKEANLYAFINNSPDSIITVTREYKVGLINEVQKARYKGTQYENVSEGSDILQTLGAVADEWKAYYDRTFRGETLNFTLKSSVQGEDTVREYRISPIRAKSGEVVAATVVSRDVSAHVKNETRLRQHEALLHQLAEEPVQNYIALDTNFKVLIASKGCQQAFPLLKAQPKAGDAFLRLLETKAKAHWQEQLTNACSGLSVQLAAGNNQAGADQSVQLQPVFGQDGQVLALLLTV